MIRPSPARTDPFRSLTQIRLVDEWRVPRDRTGRNHVITRTAALSSAASPALAGPTGLGLVRLAEGPMRRGLFVIKCISRICVSLACFTGHYDRSMAYDSDTGVADQQPGAVTVWSDIGCPWATLALHTLHAEASARGQQITVIHRAFPLELFNRMPTPKFIVDATEPASAAVAA